MQLHTKRWLPYRLRWEAEVLAVDKPRSVSIRARGDLDGRGEWRFAEDGEFVDVRYDWTVYVTKPSMVVLSPLLRPIFVANHRWAMQRGFEGLTREKTRRNLEGHPHTPRRAHDRGARDDLERVDAADRRRGHGRRRQIPDPAHIGAVAIGSLIFTFVFWAFGFLRMGTTGLTAQAIGADDATRSRRASGGS